MNIPSNLNTIIDGYNLIFQCGLEGRTRSPQALEKARMRLVSTIAKHMNADDLRKTLVVFDAERLPIKEVDNFSVKRGIYVAFAVEYDEADTMIEELIGSHSHPKDLLVVSSDHRLHKAALRRKATPIDSDVWFDRLGNDEYLRQQPSKGSQEAAGDKSLPDSLTDIDWEKEFDLSEPSANSSENRDGSPKTFDPFPPGYADDIEDEFSGD